MWDSGDGLIRKLRKILQFLHFHSPDFVNLVQIRCGWMAKLAAISALATPFLMLCRRVGRAEAQQRWRGVSDAKIAKKQV